MALTDEQIMALSDLGKLGAKIISLRDHIAKITAEIQGLQSKKTSMKTQLQTTKAQFQDDWDALINA